MKQSIGMSYRDATRHAQLKPFQRQGGKHRRKRYGSGARASCIPNRVSITERSHEVEKKTPLGDWECDTEIGKDRKSVLVTMVDRASLYTYCSRVLSRSAQGPGCVKTHDPQHFSAAGGTSTPLLFVVCLNWHFRFVEPRASLMRHRCRC